MLGFETSTVTLAALWVCLGGTLLSVLFLWLQFHSAQQLSRSISGIFAVVFLGSAVVLWLAGFAPEVFAPFILLATFCLAVRAAYSRRARKFAKRLAQPKWIWGLLLLICGVASGYLTLRVNAPDSANFFTGFSETSLHDVPDIKAVTDAGREIDLFHFDESDELGELERETLAADLLAHQIIRLGRPDNVSNCHGWVFTGGQYGVHGREIDHILLDNGYVEVADVREGDLVIYRSPEGEIDHTGVVRLMGADALLVLADDTNAASRFDSRVAALARVRVSRVLANAATLGLNADAALRPISALLRQELLPAISRQDEMPAPSVARAAAN